MTETIAIDLPFLHTIRCVKRKAQSASLMQVVDFRPVLVPVLSSADLPVALRVTGGRGYMSTFDLLQLPDERLVKSGDQGKAVDVELLKGIVRAVREGVASNSFPRRHEILDVLVPGYDPKHELVLAEDVDTTVKSISWSNRDEREAEFIGGVAGRLLLLDGAFRFVEDEPVWSVRPSYDPQRLNGSIRLDTNARVHERVFRVDRLEDALTFARRVGIRDLEDIPDVEDMGIRSWRRDEDGPIHAHLKSLINALWHNQFGSMNLSMQSLDFFSAFCGIRDSVDLESAMPYLQQMRLLLVSAPTSDEVMRKFSPIFDQIMWSLEHQRAPGEDVASIATIRI